MFENVTAKWTFSAQHFVFRLKISKVAFLKLRVRPLLVSLLLLSPLSPLYPLWLSEPCHSAIVYLPTRHSQNLFPLAYVRPKGLPVNNCK